MVVVAVAVAEEEALVAVYDRYDVKDGDDRNDGNDDDGCDDNDCDDDVINIMKINKTL